MFVSPYPGREQLYDFADQFIPLNDKFIKKNYSQRAFFLDFFKYLKIDSFLITLIKLFNDKIIINNLLLIYSRVNFLCKIFKYKRR